MQANLRQGLEIRGTVRLYEGTEKRSGTTREKCIFC